MLAGFPAPAPGPQPYLGKIFSCRRRSRQEGLSVAPSINSRRLGLPPGLESRVSGSRAGRSRPHHSARVAPARAPLARAPLSLGPGAASVNGRRTWELRRAGVMAGPASPPRARFQRGEARRLGHSAGTQAQPRSGCPGCAGGSGAPPRSAGLATWARATPGCRKKSFPNCGKRQGLKPHGNSPFARRREEEGESLKAEVPAPRPGYRLPTGWVDLISLLPLWASISPFVGAGFDSAQEVVAGSKAVGRALDRRRSPHLFTSSRPGTLGGTDAHIQRGCGDWRLCRSL